MSVRWNLIVQIAVKELLEKVVGVVGEVNRRLEDASGIDESKII